MLSAVAGIIDRRGGIRFVVTPEWRLPFHLKHGEMLFVVPGFLTKEPVPWDYIPVLIRRVELYIEWWITTRNDPAVLRNRCIRRYLKNPNAYHHLRPQEHHYPGMLELVRVAA